MYNYLFFVLFSNHPGVRAYKVHGIMGFIHSVGMLEDVQCTIKQNIAFDSVTTPAFAKRRVLCAINYQRFETYTNNTTDTTKNKQNHGCWYNWVGLINSTAIITNHCCIGNSICVTTENIVWKSQLTINWPPLNLFYYCERFKNHGNKPAY